MFHKNNPFAKPKNKKVVPKKNKSTGFDSNIK